MKIDKDFIYCYFTKLFKDIILLSQQKDGYNNKGEGMRRAMI